MTSLTHEKIIKGIDGSMWLQYARKKTGVRGSLPLLEQALELIERYGTYNKYKGSALFPVACNQIVNRQLKVIGKAASVGKSITFHMARHTFATTITLSAGIPIETVSKMLGHTNLTTTPVYAKVIDNKVMDDMAALRKLYTRQVVEEIKKAE